MADEIAASRTPAVGSSQRQEGEKPLPKTLAEWKAAGLAALKSSHPRNARAIELALDLIGAWPKSEVDNPETYTMSIAAALREYPVGIAEQCADPRIGLARTREFLPTVAAVHTWCQDRMKVFEVIKAIEG